MKNMSRKLAMPLLGVLLWVISIHAGTFAAAALLPRPITGLARTAFFYNQPKNAYEDSLSRLRDLKIPDKDLTKSVNFGNGVVDRMQRLETNLGWSKIQVDKGTPSHGEYIVSAPEKEATAQGKDALVAAKATSHLMNTFCSKHNLNPKECAKYISTYSLASTPLESSCTKLHKVCTEEELLSKYRKIDGACNHKNDGSRGEAFTGYKRLLHPDYMDGVQEPRRAVSKKVLPSARLISTSLFKEVEAGEDDLTLAVMQWSQFIEHDMSHTVANRMVHTETTIECCSSSGGNLSPRYVHPFCAPIAVPYDDKYYSKHGLDCMTYVRSVPAHRSDCSFGPIDQINQATHFLDASQIYGTTFKKSFALRTFADGRLASTRCNGETFLPTSTDPTQDCQYHDDSVCFLAGDGRVNVHPQLAAMHTLWIREHNRLADKLALLNPKWDDETLYQEARRIVVAEIQQITYKEWIPEVLGKKYASKIMKYNAYSDNINPSVSNSFATAALRVLNSLMDDKVKLYKENRAVNCSLNLRDHFNKPEVIEEPGYLDAIVRGLATQGSQKLDAVFVEDVMSHLFTNGNYGYDLFSLDIQRGRDHGLPSYTAYRTLCGLPDVRGFEDFADVMSPEAVKSLKAVYDNPHDVDLIVGGVSEKPYGDSIFGPTFSCIVADQFLRTRRGDRYFYNNDRQPVPFSKSQIREIEKVTLARIFCDNTSGIKKMQLNVFRTVKESNNLVDCEEIPSLDLRMWLDSREKYF